MLDSTHRPLRRLAHVAIAGVALLWLAACAGHAAVPRPTPTPTMVLASTNPPRVTINRRNPLARDQIVNAIIQHMTLDQQIGQLLMVEIESVDYNSGIDAMIRQDDLGGLIIYNNQPRTIAQMQNLLAQSQASADLPLVISIDEEGGDVDRLASFFSPTPSAAAIGSEAYPSPALTDAQHFGQLDAQRMLQLGFNADLAPVVDVGDANTALEGPRLWATTPGLVASLAGSFLTGLQSTGVAGTLKHWPGIGSLPVGADPHNELPTIKDSLSTLWSVDFAPFQAILSRHPAMVMVTHVLVPVIDPSVPATLSPALIDGVLRGQLGYQGVVITDSLHMHGIIDYLVSQGYSLNDFPALLGEAGVEAVLAGDDILEGAYDVDPASAGWMFDALKAAVASGRISRARIEQSDRRILDMKWDYAMGRDRLLRFAGISTGGGQTVPIGAIAVPVPSADVTPSARDSHWG